MKDLCRQLAEEHAALDEMMNGLPDAKWDMKTPFAGWTIKDEICHIASFDSKANLAATDPDGFQRDIERLSADIASNDDFHEKIVMDLRKFLPKALMEFWVDKRTKMIKAFEILGPEDKIPWYGPPMTAASFVIARIMETWAHGQDIADTLHLKRQPTERLRHIAHLGVKTFGWSYKNRGLEKPADKVRVELKSPAGETWLWNEEYTDNLIAGNAEDFCLVVAQRRHIDDTGLIAKGDIAREWMLLAQVFAGPPVKGPDAGKFK